MRQLPKERAINPTGVKILLSHYVRFGGSSLAKSHFVLKLLLCRMQETCLGKTDCKLRLLKPQGKGCPGCLCGARLLGGRAPTPV